MLFKATAVTILSYLAVTGLGAPTAEASDTELLSQQPSTTDELILTLPHTTITREGFAPPTPPAGEVEKLHEKLHGSASGEPLVLSLPHTTVTLSDFTPPTVSPSKPFTLSLPHTTITFPSPGFATESSD